MSVGPRPVAVGGVLLTFILPTAGCKPARKPPPKLTDGPSVLLVTLDTTRADHLGCYGYSKRISPNLDRFADSAVLFTKAISQAAVTPVSHASILTGLNPCTHGLRVMHGLTENRLPASCVTLSEVLQSVGYQTAAFVSAFPVSKRFGLHQGFETFQADFMQELPREAITPEGIVNTGMNQRHAGDTTDLALDWLTTAGEPFLLWLHYFDPHDSDLMPPQEFLGRFPPGPRGTVRETLRYIYDLEIQYMDQQLGRVLDELERTGRLEKMVVVIVADHGEGLGDHDWWTHGILYTEQVRVPLMIRAPSSDPGQKVDYLVRCIDIMPTVLELVGLSRDNWPLMEGSSLVPLLKPDAGNPNYVAYCDSVNMLSYGMHGGIRDVKDDMLFAVVDGDWKYIHHLLRETESELYNLAMDPGELNNLIGSHAGPLARLRAELKEHDFLPERQLRGAWRRMSPEDVQRLRSLGYID